LNDCVFCNQKRISGTLVPATPQTVSRAIEGAQFSKDDVAVKQLAFFGGSFTAIPIPEQEALLRAAQSFLAEHMNASIRISTRPDCIDGKTLSRLRRYGVRTIELGAQSMDETVLAASGRGHTAQDTVNASRLIKQYGFELILQMMTGLPEDTPEKAISTAEKLVMLKPDGVRLYPTVVIRDTKLYDMWKNGAYKEHAVEDAVSLCAAVYRVFYKAGIPIIRLGLNPTEELSGGDAVAGAYHPAFGELVLSRVYLDNARNLLKEAFAQMDRECVRRVTLGVAPERISVMTGHGKSNIKRLREEFGCESVRVVAVNAEPGEIVIMCIENTMQ
jgi:histone acetyltransferase (RNA polymerase elongator complex component)